MKLNNKGKVMLAVMVLLLFLAYLFNHSAVFNEFVWHWVGIAIVPFILLIYGASAIGGFASGKNSSKNNFY